ncbi:HpsJ family protein [Acaryochloris sp. IP29b_bin.148]|uniref:HpsJ-like protein, cyanoexosortase A-associated n=1 Tax=Acaryochloris sp. IP29b_bin.148 TaxID=2969218 RepID=UPI0026258255|nr:HpsJ family protein [Acaryochloris sp. IP29b_bin.148]
MDKPTDQQLTRKVDLAYNTAEALVKNLQSMQLLNWIGYGFLLFTLLDFIAAIFPPNFTSAAWEFGLVGNLVERVAAPLIGLGFVFLGGHSHRSLREQFVLKILSWAAFGFAVLYGLLIVLGLSSTLRIDGQNNKQITTQAKRTQNQLQQVRSALQSVTTREEMEIFLGRLNNQEQAPKIENDQQFQSTRQEVTDFLDQGEKRLKTQMQSTRQTQRRRLLKNSFKWTLGALLSTALFIVIWRGTVEVRRG